MKSLDITYSVSVDERIAEYLKIFALDHGKIDFNQEVGTVVYPSPAIINQIVSFHFRYFIPTDDERLDYAVEVFKAFMAMKCIIKNMWLIAA